MITTRVHRPRWWLIVAMALLSIAPAAVAQDAVIRVTRTDNPAPDGCRPDDCSLREAITEAAGRPGADVVDLPAGVFQLRRVDRTTTTAPYDRDNEPFAREGGVGQGLYITGELTLRGVSREETVLDLSRLPPLNEGGRVGPGIWAEDATLTIEKLTARDAQAIVSIAGVLFAGGTALTLRSVAIVDNGYSAVNVNNFRGGGSVTIEDSLFAGNAGGAFSAYFGSVFVRRSVFSDNGGVALWSSGATVEDSLFIRNDLGLVAESHMLVRRSRFIGNTGHYGGAMKFYGSAPTELDRVLVEDNTAILTSGGGVEARNLVVRDSVFRGNSAGIAGGAIDMFTSHGDARPFLQVFSSAFVNNSAGFGGAIRVDDGEARLTNVTLSGNVAREAQGTYLNGVTEPAGKGAAMYVDESSTAFLGHTTVIGSRAELGALYNMGILELGGSVLADTATPAGAPVSNCVTVNQGATSSNNYNLADDNSCQLNRLGDKVGAPDLGPLVATGGTLAHIPEAESPLVDAADYCCTPYDSQDECPSVDQRGGRRAIDGDRDGQAFCDIGAVEALSGRVGRVAGPDRVATAVAVSQASFGDQQAGVVVLARSDGFADGLAGGPLSAAEGGPLLLTGRDGLDPAVEAELLRVLPEGGEVILLGGSAALRAAVEDRVAEVGYRPVRVAGTDRYATAAAVAGRLDDPQSVLLASGSDFPDALSAGAAAAATGSAVLLTADDQLPAPARAYLDAHPGLERIAVGGPAAAADPGAEPLVGPDRYSTAVAVARRFHDHPTRLGVASGVAFPDALAAAGDSAKRGGPLLLSSPEALPAVVAEYLVEIASTLADAAQPALIYGGEKALSLQVEAAVDAAL